MSSLLLFSAVFWLFRSEDLRISSSSESSKTAPLHHVMLLLVLHCGSFFRLVPTGFDRLRPVPTGSDPVPTDRLGRPVPTCPTDSAPRFRPVPAGSGRIRPVPAEYGRFRPVPTGSDGFRNGSDWSEPVENGRNRSEPEPVGTGRNWSELVGTDRNPSEPVEPSESESVGTGRNLSEPIGIGRNR